MKLKSLLTFFFLFILVFFLILLFSVTKLTNLLEQEAHAISNAGEGVRIGEELKSTLLRHNRNFFLHAIHLDAWRLIRTKSQEKKIEELLQLASAFTSDKQEKEVLLEIDQEINSYFLSQKKANENPGTSPLQNYERTGLTVERVLVVIDKFVAINHLQMSTLLNEVKQQNKMADILTISALAIILFIAGIIFVGLSIAVIRPLLALSDTISRYSSGSIQVRAKAIGLYEIVEIAKNFNHMADHIEVAKQNQLRSIASIAHDLRNPLSSVTTASELLMLKCESKDQELLSIIHEQIKSLDRQVNDLLDMTRIESGHINLQRETVDIRTIIRQAVDLYRLSSHSHKFKLELGPEPLLCHCDPIRLSQVFNNLISNAIKYSPAGGVVSIKAEIVEGNIVISISDRGIGISEDDLDKIFKPFQRSQATRNTIVGVGLGLSTSRHIIEAHRGSLTVDSNLGRGSTFKITMEMSHGDEASSSLLQ